MSGSQTRRRQEEARGDLGLGHARRRPGWALPVQEDAQRAAELGHELGDEHVGHFAGAKSSTSPRWDTSSVTNIASTFAPQGLQLGLRDTSLDEQYGARQDPNGARLGYEPGSTMQGTFYGANAFNQPLGDWEGQMWPTRMHVFGYTTPPATTARPDTLLLGDHAEEHRLHGYKDWGSGLGGGVPGCKKLSKTAMAAGEGAARRRGRRRRPRRGRGKAAKEEAGRRRPRRRPRRRRPRRGRAKGQGGAEAKKAKGTEEEEPPRQCRAKEKAGPSKEKAEAGPRRRRGRGQGEAEAKADKAKEKAEAEEKRRRRAARQAEGGG